MPRHRTVTVSRELLGRVVLLTALATPLILPAAVAGVDGNVYVTEANQERTAYGVLPLLSYSSVVEAAADERARYMAATNDFAHDMQPLVDRLNAAKICYSGYAEIIAYNSKRDVAYTMTQWMASDGHRAIILKAAYDKAAGSWADATVAVNGSYRRYHVMYFYDPCNTPPASSSPTPSPSPTATWTPSATNSPAPTATPLAATPAPTPTATPTTTRAPTPTPSPSPSPTPSPTPTQATAPIASSTPSATPQPVVLATPTPTPAATPIPSVSPSPSPSPVPDTTAPKVLSRSPAAGATSVSLRPRVAISFSETVRNVTPSTFYLRDPLTGRSVAAILRFDSASRATLRPLDSLLPSRRYQAVVTSGVRDRAGNAVALTTWTFTTRR